MKNDFESGYCTYPQCGTFLRDGEGQQFQRPNGELDRFCQKHAREEMEKTSDATQVGRVKEGLVG